MEEKGTKGKTPSFGFAVVNLLLIVGILMAGILAFKLDEHVLLLCCIVVMSIACLILGYSWSEIQEAMIAGVTKALAALFFFFLIGAAVGAWVNCGTLPGLIHYGLMILSPGWFLPATLIICSLVAICIGSSWTTAGTVGVVLLGIGVTMGIPAPLIAGCIVSGAFFGDKMSPMSDTTNLAPAIAGTDVLSHVRAMMWTAAPAFVVTLVVYFFLGLRYADNALNTADITEIQNAIMDNFKINPIVLLPIVLLLVLSIAKFPAIPGLAISVIVAYPISAILQGTSLSQFFEVINYGNSYETGVAAVDELVNRGGIQEMMWTFSLGVFALVLGGLITKSGILQVLIGKLIERLPSRRFLPMCTIITGILGCGCLGEQYMSIVVTAELYKDAYPKAGLKRQMLSRCVEESATVTSSFFPWTTCGAYMYAALGVHPFVYAPYAILNWLTPILGALLPLTGFSLLTEDGDKESKEKTA
ncbi:MAG: Na+/H+ antiporter NhaC [Eubacteriales bacterium]|nr:Na+/H+ antiporter NhaC [Eubacteriales bacterium]